MKPIAFALLLFSCSAGPESPQVAQATEPPGSTAALPDPLATGNTEPVNAVPENSATPTGVIGGPEGPLGSIPGEVPPSETRVPVLPACGSTPLPSSELNLSTDAGGVLFPYDGPATVTRISLSASGRPVVVNFDLGRGADIVSLQGSSALYLPFALDDEVHIQLIEVGALGHHFAIIRDLEGTLLLAYYSFNDSYLVDDRLEALLGIQLQVAPECELDTSCTAVAQVLGAKLSVNEQLFPVAQEKVVDVNIDGVPHKFVWRGGIERTGGSTGICSHTLLGKSLAFLLVRTDALRR